jgi:hypothetical protein
MLYNPEKSLGYLAQMQLLEDTHTKAVHAATGVFLAEALAVKKGDVVEVAPIPRQYFSRGRRFLILSVTAHVGRDKETGHYAGVVPSLVGVFLNDAGEAIQSIRFTVTAGHLHTESLALNNSKYLAAPIEKLAEDQSHKIDLG